MCLRNIEPSMDTLQGMCISTGKCHRGGSTEQQVTSLLLSLGNSSGATVLWDRTTL